MKNRQNWQSSPLPAEPTPLIFHKVKTNVNFDFSTTYLLRILSPRVPVFGHLGIPNYLPHTATQLQYHVLVCLYVYIFPPHSLHLLPTIR